MKCLVLVLVAAALVASVESEEEPIKQGRRQEDEVYLVQLLVSPAKVKDKGGIRDKTSPIVARVLTPDKQQNTRTRRSPRFNKKGEGYAGCNSCGGGSNGGGLPGGGVMDMAVNEIMAKD